MTKPPNRDGGREWFALARRSPGCETSGFDRGVGWTRSTLLKIPGQSLLRKCVNTNSAPPLAGARWGAIPLSVLEQGRIEGVVFDPVDARCLGWEPDVETRHVPHSGFKTGLPRVRRVGCV